MKKQAHLLSKAELKRRGITRYDAEILLAQGINLPEPKVNLGGKIPSPLRKSQSIKVSELRLSPRKHLSSQSYLKSLSDEDLPVGHEHKLSKQLQKNFSDNSNLVQNMVTNGLAGPLADITVNKPQSGQQVNLNVQKIRKSRPLVNRHSRHGKRTKKLSHRRALRLDLGCVPDSTEESRQSGLLPIGLRHSPRLKSKEDIQSDNKQLQNNSRTNLNGDTNVIETGDPDITFKLRNDPENRNIFTQLQIDVMENSVDSDEETLSEIARRKKSKGVVNCPKLIEQLRAPPAEMPHLTPYDSEPACVTSYKNCRVSPKLSSFNASCTTEQITKNACGTNSLSLLASELKKPVRQSPRTKNRNRNKKEETSVVNGMKEINGYDVMCNEMSGSNLGLSENHSTAWSSFSQNSQKFSESKKSGASSYIGSNVFEKFGNISGHNTCTGDSHVEVGSESEEIDVEGLGDSLKSNKHLSSFRKLNSPSKQQNKNSQRLRNFKERKRRLSYENVRSPKFGEPLRKKINALNEDMAEYRHLWASISPPKKVPKITIKMPRDPVLVKELEHSKSESVRFKLESPHNSLTATPESSDHSDSDEEESPLNCTKYRPFIPASSTRRQSLERASRSLYSDGEVTDDIVCPKLMRIKFGGTQIDINIPQKKLG